MNQLETLGFAGRDRESDSALFFLPAFAGAERFEDSPRTRRRISSRPSRTDASPSPGPGCELGARAIAVRTSARSHTIRFRQAVYQLIGTIYQGAPGETGRPTRERAPAEHATSNTTEEANDRCRTPDDSTAEEKHSDHNRTNIAPRQAPAWAPFTFRGLSCQLRRAAHDRFVEARPPRPTSTHLRSRRAH